MRMWIYTEDGKKEEYEIDGRYGCKSDKTEAPGQHSEGPVWGRPGGEARMPANYGRFGPESKRDEGPGRYGDLPYPRHRPSDGPQK